ncbi:MAG: ferric iron reductase [Pseudomonadota bacterium]
MIDELVITPAADEIPADRALSERAAPASFAQAVADAGAIGERFRLSIAGFSDGDLQSADGIGDDALQGLVAARGKGLGTSEPRVAATLFLQAYAYRIAAPGLALWVQSGLVPDMSASNLLLRFDAEGRPIEVYLRDPVVFSDRSFTLPDANVRAVPDLTSQAVESILIQHLLPLHDRLRVLYRLGPLLAKGAVASQIGMALTFIDANTTVAWRDVAATAVAFFNASRDQIEGQGRTGDMIVKRLGELEGTTWRRRTCCLVYQAPERDYCGGCPIRKEPDRNATWARRLQNRSTRSTTDEIKR